MSDNSTEVIIDNSDSHGNYLFPPMQELYENGILTDRHLEVGGKKLACHRLVLAVCSPVLQAMLTSGMTEAQTKTIPIKLFSAEVMEAIVRYMYSGILQLKDENLVQEVIAATDYFQMDGLTKDLEVKYKYKVVPSNVLSWAKVADMYNLLNLKETCDRVQLVKFEEVVKCEEFHKLSKEEVLLYFKKCKPYSGISSDDFLHAAVIWMAENEPFPDLITQIDLKKCSQRALKAAMSHPAIPPNVITRLKNCKKGRRKEQEKQQTMAYITCRECVVVGKNAQLRWLHKYENFDHMTSMDTHKVCYTRKGYMLVKDEKVDDLEVDESYARATIYQYDETNNELTQLPGAEVKESGVWFSIIHKDRMYMVSDCERDYIFFYDMKKCFWSKLLVPDESKTSTNHWRAAVAGNDLFFMNNRLHLYRLGKDKLERIQTSFGDFEKFFFCITAVHRWLYVFKGIDSENLEVYCYDTESGLWTEIHTNFMLHDDSLGEQSSIMFENKIYFVGYAYENDFAPKLYEYNLCDDSVKKSSRPSPETTSYHLAVIDVVTERLEENCETSIFDETESWDEESDTE